MKILLQNNHLGWPSDVIAITLRSEHIEGCHILSVTGSKNKEANLCIGPCMACLLGNPCWPNSTKKNAKRPKKNTLWPSRGDAKNCFVSRTRKAHST